MFLPPPPPLPKQLKARVLPQEVNQIDTAQSTLVSEYYSKFDHCASMPHTYCVCMDENTNIQCAAVHIIEFVRVSARRVFHKN